MGRPWLQRISALVGLLALAAAVVVLTVRERRPEPTADPCAAAKLAADRRAATVTGGGDRLVVLGDSYSVGRDPDDPLDTWATALPGEVHVLGFSGSGFTASPCPRTSYPDRVTSALALAPDIVVVEGGLNDWQASRADLVAAASRLLDELEGTPVVFVGPARAPARIRAAERVDRVLARTCRRFGVPYVSTIDWDLDFLPDRLHLTRAGQAEFGRRVEQAVTRQLASGR